MAMFCVLVLGVEVEFVFFLKLLVYLFIVLLIICLVL